MRKQAGFLEDVADRTLVRGAEGRPVLPDVACHDAGPVRDAVQSGETPQHRGLPAAGRPEESGHADSWCHERGVQLEAADSSSKGCVDDGLFPHAPARPTRFSMSVMDRITAKANTTIPPARMLASRHWPVST